MSFTEVISDNEDLDTKYPGNREEKEESFLYYTLTMEDLLVFLVSPFFDINFFKYLGQNDCKRQGKSDCIFSSFLGILMKRE